MVISTTLDNAAALREYIEQATTRTEANVPGAVVHIVDSQNNTIFSHGAGGATAPTAKSISIIHSLTKLVGAIAFLQLAERNLVTLDDPSLITKYLPELASQKVLVGYAEGKDGKKEWQFEDRKADITPRMLLNHTYGGGHTFFNSLLYAYFADLGIADKAHEAADTYRCILASPLLWQPGTRVNYAQGLDWIAVSVERLTKGSLADFLEENIFAPLGLRSMGLEPVYGGDVLSRAENRGRFWLRVMKAGEDLVKIDEEEPQRIVREDAWPKGAYHTGRLGTGLVSSAEDYARLATIFLPENMGVDAMSGHRLLSAESVKEIISPQLPEGIDNAVREVPWSGGSPIVLPAVLGSQYLDPAGSFGLACGVQGEERKLENGKRGRSKGSVYWYGAANTDYWIDREKGIVVVINGNYYPWNDAAWTEFVAGAEGMIYEGLKRVE